MIMKSFEDNYGAIWCLLAYLYPTKHVFSTSCYMEYFNSFFIKIEGSYFVNGLQNKRIPKLEKRGQ